MKMTKPQRPYSLRFLRSLLLGRRRPESSRQGASWLSAVWKSVVTALLVTALYVAGALEIAELKLLDAKYSLVERSVESDLVIVAIDPKSLKRIGYWPWPRSLHAFLLDRLAEAGAGRVAFDIDFSSHSRVRNDAAFEQALARFPGTVVLPGFVQNANPLERNGILVSTLPLDQFLPHVELASVNVLPDKDGLVRHMERSGPLGGHAVPSLSALLAQDRDAVSGGFAIDFGIRLYDIPVVSYADVLTGDFAPEVLAGRTVLIGATAFELGDVLPVPVYGALPGVMLQALAAESLSQDRELTPVAAWVVILLVFALCFFTCGRLQGSDWRRGLYLALLLPLALFIASCVVQGWSPLMLDVVPLGLAVVATYAVNVLGTLQRQNKRLLAQRFALRRQDRLMNSVVEHSFDAIITLDQMGRITSFNRSARALLADPDAEVQGRDIGDFIRRGRGEDSEACSIDCIAEIAWGGRPCELLGRRQSGTHFPLEVSVSYFEENDQTTHIVLFRDITDRKEAEAEVEASRQGLIAAKERAEAADRAKSEFLANMSHELRTPLNAVIGFSEVMKTEMLGPIGNATYQSYAKDIHDSGEHLLRMINDILDISKIETGVIVPSEECFYLDDTVNACLRMVRPRAAAAEVQLPADLALPVVAVRADARLLKQAVLNVLSNAIKFTPAGGRVSVGLETRSDGDVAVVVTDTGPGIPEAELAAALEPFRQLDSSLARAFEGAGLGLPLTKAFIELHDGRLILESEVGQGTVVTLLLPAARVESLGPGGPKSRLAS